MQYRLTIQTISTDKIDNIDRQFRQYRRTSFHNGTIFLTIFYFSDLIFATICASFASTYNRHITDT